MSHTQNSSDPIVLKIEKYMYSFLTTIFRIFYFMVVNVRKMRRWLIEDANNYIKEENNVSTKEH